MPSGFLYLLLFAGTSYLSFAVGNALVSKFKVILFRELVRVRRMPGLRAAGEARLIAAIAVGTVIASVGLSALLTGRPIFGLTSALFLPWLVSWAGSALRARKRRALEESAVGYLHALRGLIRAGMSLPAALFQLSRRVPAPFAEGLSPFLERFQSGRSLSDCLRRFRHRADLARVGTLLAVCEAAYQNGLPLLPVLDAQLPVLEAEARAAERILSLRRAAFVQIVGASALPWILGLALFSFQPDLVNSFLSSSPAVWVIAGAIGLELAGGLAIANVASFYPVRPFFRGRRKQAGLDRRDRRRWRHDLVHFLDVLGLYLHAGYDLAYAWPEALKALESEMISGLVSQLRIGEAGLLQGLEKLETGYADAAHRVWFAVIGELYSQGASLRGAVQAVSDTLRGEHDRALDEHCRTLPTRINVLMLLFYFPAIALLLFAPLLLELGHALGATLS